jgi:hypothetical protein
MPDAVVVTAVMAPAHILSMANPGTDCGRPASMPALRPRVRPWSPSCVVAAMATSSMRSGGSEGLRRRTSRSSRTTMSSARVCAYIPFSPALPNGVRTPSTNTTSRPESTPTSSSMDHLCGTRSTRYPRYRVLANGRVRPQSSSTNRSTSDGFPAMTMTEP